MSYFYSVAFFTGTYSLTLGAIHNCHLYCVMRLHLLGSKEIVVIRSCGIEKMNLFLYV